MGNMWEVVAAVLVDTHNQEELTCCVCLPTYFDPLLLSNVIKYKNASKVTENNKSWYEAHNTRGSTLEEGLAGFENVVKRTSNGAYRSPRCLAVTKHPMPPGGSSVISL